MIYLDNAATTWPKPPSVKAAMAYALERYGANPGRSGHALSLDTARAVYRCREVAAEFFGLDDPSRVIFTPNCTASLNIVIKGLLMRGGHAVISDLEHNSVVRPLEALAENGVEYSVASVVEGDDERTVENFKKCLRPTTKLILCTHASNVFGTVLPIAKIGKLARESQIPFAVDAAQSAGILPINMEQDEIDYLCVPGHKGLYGPMGTGLLLCRDRRELYTLMQGGTGSRSLSLVQPHELPDRLESGTINVPGICGLEAGVRWVNRQNVDAVRHHETRLVRQLYDSLCRLPAVELYTEDPSVQPRAPLLSFNVVGRKSEEVAALLSNEGIAVRAGLHCAPMAHRRMGTLPSGTVRIAPSAFTTKEEIQNLVKILIKMSRKP